MLAHLFMNILNEIVFKIPKGNRISAISFMLCARPIAFSHFYIIQVNCVGILACLHGYSIQSVSNDLLLGTFHLFVK